MQRSYGEARRRSGRGGPHRDPARGAAELGCGPQAAGYRDAGAGRLLSHYARIGLKFLVVAKREDDFTAHHLEQGDAHGTLDGSALGQPDFVIDACVFNGYVGALGETDQKAAEGDGVQRFDVDLDPLVILLVDPQTQLDLGKECRGRTFWTVSGLGRAFDHEGFTAVERFLAGEFEGKGFGQFLERLALFLLLALPVGDATLALPRGLFAPVGDAVLELLFLFALVFWGERLVVAGHQAAVGGPLQQGHVEGCALGLFQLAAGIQVALFLALQKGVAARDLGVVPVEFGSAADDLQRVLGGQEGGQRKTEQQETHGYTYGSVPGPVSSGRLRIPVLMVC